MEEFFSDKNNVIEEINKLKEQDGLELHVYGSSKLIKTLVNENLVDFLKVWIFPVAVGKGKQLFGEGINASKLKLVDIKSSSTGVIISTYQPDEAIKISSSTIASPFEEELVRRK